MKNVFNKSLKATKLYMFVILICSIISSFLTIYLTKFISFVIDGVIMKKMVLPGYITKSFYSDDIKSKLIVLAMYMLIFIIISNGNRELYYLRKGWLYWKIKIYQNKKWI